MSEIIKLIRRAFSNNYAGGGITLTRQAFSEDYDMEITDTITIPGTGDILAILDATDNKFKKITRENLLATPGAIGGTTPAAGHFTTLDTTGNVGIGTTEPGEKLNVVDGTILAGHTSSITLGGDIQLVQAIGTGTDSGFGVARYANSIGGSFLILSKSRSGTKGTPTVVQDNDYIGTIDFASADGSDMNTISARIRAEVNDASITTSQVGGALTFSTAPGTSADDIAERMRITSAGNVGIGTLSPNQELTVEGSISLVDQAAAAADTAGYGQIWVSNATPDELWFTDDAGTDTQLSSHPLDAPDALYINGPGLDWIGKRVQKYLSVIFWQKLDGTIIEETFVEYNARRKDIPGHVDLVKRDWNTVQMAMPRAEALKETIEEDVVAKDAFEDVEIMEEVVSETKTEYVYDETGEVKAIEKPMKITRGTGQFEKRLKVGISFDSETGKFTLKRQRTEAEVDAMNLKVPEMPRWMKDYQRSN